MVISKAFYIGKYEVTQEEYETVTGANPSDFKVVRNPVENISWDQAVAFCKKVSARTGRTVRLPTEAEWEAACRAGSDGRFGFGDRDGDLHNYGNYADQSANLSWCDKSYSDGQPTTTVVGLSAPTPGGWAICTAT